MSTNYKKLSNSGLILKRPYITEKSSNTSAQAKPGYTFEVNSDFNKNEVRRAVKDVYGVTPIRVNIINTSEKQVFSKGKWGTKGAIKKAIVFLKKGDKIEFV